LAPRRSSRPREWAARAIGLEDDGILFNLPCVYAVAGEADTALDCLEGAVHHGFTGRRWIEQDTDLDLIREMDRFRALLATMMDA
jgi:adenylate cyclase